MSTVTCETAALAAVLLAACSSPSTDAQTCPELAEQPLVNGAASESYLGLADGQLRASVWIDAAANGQGPLCTGAMVASDWVLTAGHCAAAAVVVVAAHS